MGAGSGLAGRSWRRTSGTCCRRSASRGTKSWWPRRLRPRRSRRCRGWTTSSRAWLPRDFVEHEGHALVPRTHKEDGVSLRSWLNNQKARRGKLSTEQLGRLKALEVGW
ncbi:helicase associated domain-containing protein [Kitasatospora sp. NPDC087861]|uniref:helicase associated domain-containing protein n=1 Tax=Kitasatospora sp. NPDC087861 TaxID=3364070 RepID=UPI0038290EAC